jgi:ADP-ribosylglycohydrolase
MELRPITLDPQARLELARDTLEGLSVGDALGEALSYQYYRAREWQVFSAPAWGYVRFTDDTAMALGIIECLSLFKAIEEDALAWIFGKNFKSDPDRGYGKMARRILTQLSEGVKWQTVSSSAFGKGSFGNGSAMRVGPLGAYFFDDLRKVSTMAAASARVTHFHPEGVAGAVAVAVATATATASRLLPPEEAALKVWESVVELTPEGQTARALKTARSFEPGSRPADVAKAVGCGYDVSCQDTVPFAVWNACRCLGDFREALLSTVEVGGDCDTNAAIVCGIVSSYGSPSCIPEDWRRVREPLPRAK